VTRIAELVRDPDFTLYQGDVLDVLRELPAGSVDATVTSPPYGNARDEYPAFDKWQALFYELGRVCDGPALINVGRRWRAGVEQLWWTEIIGGAQAEGWALVDTLVWIKPNANPIHGEVFANRHEYVLILARPGDIVNVDDIRVPYAASSVPRMRRGWINHTGVKHRPHKEGSLRSSEPHPLGGRPPSYVTVYTGREKGNPHPAPMAEGLADHLVKLAVKTGQTILDPFAGSGTTALSARRLGRQSVLIELDPKYAALTAQRLSQQSLLAEGAA
jgi:DNA modification methylase